MIVQISSLLKNNNPCAGYAAGRYSACLILNLNREIEFKINNMYDTYALIEHSPACV